MRTLSSNNQLTWQNEASKINIEFRRIDKFSAGSLYNQIFVTENYLIKIGLYTINICQLQNVDLILTHTNEFKLTQGGGLGTQYLNILAKPVAIPNRPIIKPFNLRINSFEYKDFNDKLYKPVIEACNIVIKQSLPEQFLDAFREQINQNTKYETKLEVNSIIILLKNANTNLIKIMTYFFKTNLIEKEIDSCIGCMRYNADVKLKRSCGPTTDCQECLCKPMWCLECKQLS